MDFYQLVTQINNTLENFAKEVGDDIVGLNITGDPKFDQPGGNFVNSPTAPTTSTPIPLTLAGTLNAGIAVVYYKGAILTKDSFSPVPISFVNEGQVADELCFIYITYDKGANAFFVNIQNTYTGVIPIPPADIENPPSNMVLSLEDNGGAIVENSPTNLVLTEENI